MKLGGLIVAGACAIALLAGCSAPLPDVVEESFFIPTDVAADTPPAFVDEPQDADDVLPAGIGIASAPGFDADVVASVRYQGEWKGEDLFLYNGHGTVFLLGVSIDDPSEWYTGSSAGNVPFSIDPGDTTVDQWMLQYLPQGTADLPDGWTAFSPWLALRDL